VNNFFEGKRKALGFQETVRRHFAFLEDQYGFECTDSDLYKVQYCNEQLFFQIWHERLSYEMYFIVGQLPVYYGNPNEVPLQSMIDIANDQSLYSVNTKEKVELAVRKLEEYAKKYAVEIIIMGVGEYFKKKANKRKIDEFYGSVKDYLESSEINLKKLWDEGEYTRAMLTIEGIKDYFNNQQFEELKTETIKIINEINNK
jgi:hypothetical protein